MTTGPVVDGLRAVTVLVLAEELDPSADRIVHILSTMDVPVFRCDTGWFPQGLTLSAELTARGWNGVLSTPFRSVPLAEIRSVWYRSPTVFRFSEMLRPEERAHAEREAKLGVGGILAALPVLWVNHPSREADAGFKVRQLNTAQQCGLLVPRTIVTNDPDAVHEFSRTCDRVVTKVLGANIIGEGANRRIAYTTLLGATELNDLSAVRETAHLFQEWIDKKYEVRVVAVGETCFSAAIYASSPAAYVDWRSDYDSLTCVPTETPEHVADGVRAYLSAFGLNYAAFDFAVNHDGQWVFLEANPGGQFGFIEGATGLPISHALATLLSRGQRANERLV